MNPQLVVTKGERIRDKIYSVYFAIHLVITLLIDVTIAVPSKYLFPIQATLGDYHIKQNKDLLVLSRPVWLQTFVWVELVFQVPFFVVAAIALWKGKKTIYPICLAYGVEAAITTLGCLSEVIFIDGVNGSERMNLLFLYLPTFIIPLFISFDFYSRLVKLIDFDNKSKSE